MVTRKVGVAGVESIPARGVTDAGLHCGIGRVAKLTLRVQPINLDLVGAGGGKGEGCGWSAG